MPEESIGKRLRLTTAVLIGATVLLYLVNRPTGVSLHRPLRQIPTALGEWRGVDLPISQRIVKIAGVSDYIDRKYKDSYGRESYVYIGYYASQRAGEQIHSPRNCLPGAGWEIVKTRRLAIDVPNERTMVVNDFLVSNGVEQDLVLYWYQTRGRVIQSEYAAKFWMLADAVTRHRTDGALVRIAIPLEASEPEARRWGISLVQVLYKNLAGFLPD